MNFIKTLKFSVKGIDTTRYISSEARNLLSSIERGKIPLSNFPRKDFKFIRGSFEGVMSTPSIERRRLLANAGRSDGFVVISNEVRNLLILERGFHPLSNFSPKAKIILIPSHSEGFCPRNLRRFMFLGGVRGGKRGDPSERHFGVTTPGHSERSETSPIQSKGAKIPLSNLPRKTYYYVISNEVRNLLSYLFWRSIEGVQLYPLKFGRFLSKSALDDAGKVISNEVRHLRLFTFCKKDL